MPLCEIKERIEERKKLLGINEHVSKQVSEVTNHIHQLEAELTQLKSLLDGLTDSQREKISKSLSGQTTTLLQTLVLLL